MAPLLRLSSTEPSPSPSTDRRGGMRWIAFIIAALLPLSSIAEAGEAAPPGKVSGLRWGFDGWRFECQAPERWYSVEAEEWQQIKDAGDGLRAVTKDKMAGPLGTEDWQIEIRNKKNET